MNRYEQAYNNWLGGRRYFDLVNITKEEWCQWWEDTKLFDMRGNSKGSVLMMRVDRAMPFQLDNIKLMQRTGKKGHSLQEVKLVTKGWDNSHGWDC